MGTTIKIKGARPTGEESLCKTCRWVHMQRGYRESEEAIFCNFGPLRRVLFKVAECSDFENRTIPPEWKLEEMALLINVDRARKKAGFKNSETDDDEVEDEKATLIE